MKRTVQILLEGVVVLAILGTSLVSISALTSMSALASGNTGGHRSGSTPP